MRKILICIIIVLNVLESNAQFIKNDLNLSFSFKTGSFQGKGLLNDNNFITPSMFSNMRSLQGLSLKGMYSLNYFNVGMNFSALNAENWSYLDNSKYIGSQVDIYTINPTIQIHNKFVETGVLNRIRVFFEIAPTFGFSNLTLVNPIFEIQSKSGIVSSPMKSTDLFFGFNGSAGFEFSISRIVGVFFSYSFQHNWVRSDLFQDKNFSSTLLDLGLFIKLKKDKRYFY